MQSTQLLAFLAQTLSYSTPVLLASLGGLFGERAGVVNIGLEGLLLVGALAAVVVTSVTGNPWLGTMAAILAGIGLAAIFALFGVGMRRDQVIVGTTINFLALGVTGILYRAWSGSGKVGGATIVKTLPRLVGEGSSALSILTIFTLLLIPVAHWLLYRTQWGVTVRATGELPAAAAAAGTNVNRLRIFIVLATGALCGLGGASLAVDIGNSFNEGMTNGRGFVALAVIVFGRRAPFGVLLASLLFAAADVEQARLQAAGFLSIPYPVFLSLPYLLTLVALAVRGQAEKPPAALGTAFEQG